jgi:hypothetical protein
MNAAEVLSVLGVLFLIPLASVLIAAGVALLTLPFWKRRP